MLSSLSLFSCVLSVLPFSILFFSLLSSLTSHLSSLFRSFPFFPFLLSFLSVLFFFSFLSFLSFLSLLSFRFFQFTKRFLTSASWNYSLWIQVNHWTCRCLPATFRERPSRLHQVRCISCQASIAVCRARSPGTPPQNRMDEESWSSML